MKPETALRHARRMAKVKDERRRKRYEKRIAELRAEGRQVFETGNGQATFTLPEPRPGMWFKFVNTSDNSVTFVARHAPEPRPSLWRRFKDWLGELFTIQIA
jgi:hypothetical protein